MCTSDLCNANDYNFHTERANRLFGRPQTSEAVRSPFFPPTASGGGRSSSSSSAVSASRNNQVTIVTPSSNLVEDEQNETLEDHVDHDIIATQEVDIVKIHDRDQERIETLWTDRFEDLLVAEESETSEETEVPRSPRQTQGKTERKKNKA